MRHYCNQAGGAGEAQEEGGGAGQGYPARRDHSGELRGGQGGWGVVVTVLYQLRCAIILCTGLISYIVYNTVDCSLLLLNILYIVYSVQQTVQYEMFCSSMMMMMISI